MICILAVNQDQRNHHLLAQDPSRNRIERSLVLVIVSLASKFPYPGVVWLAP